ncbi:vesicle transport v-snare protein vti1 [Mycena floridula]|nr:vesicle transport v-snare protein vti1 [Mycena floridula]
MSSSQTPASLFDAYEADFLSIIESVRTKHVDVKEKRGEERKAVLRRVEIELDEADDIISQLEVEIQGIPMSVRPPYSARLKQAKYDLNRYKKLSKELHSNSRAELLGNSRFSAVSASDDPYSDDRTRLLAGTHSLSDGNRRLAETTRIALETEQQGADILRDLSRQGEQIDNSRNTLRAADTSIGRATTTLKGMIWQNKKQRFIIGGIVVVLILVVILILYFKLVR